ncbi:hypothetical protein O76HUS_14910 [Escherichia coli]|nr:hypothetical protein O76HUS_14910 [Escherichia coli]
MTFKHYDVVRAASPSDLAERLTQKLKEGWQPFGSPVAITPYTLMQAIAAEGDVTTPVAVTGNEGKAVAVSATATRSITLLWFWQGSQMACRMVKVFRCRRHMTVRTRVLSSWRAAVR